MNSPVTQVRFPPPLRACLDEAVERRGCSVSDIVRYAVAEYLGLGAEAAELPPRRPGPGRGRKGASDA